MNPPLELILRTPVNSLADPAPVAPGHPGGNLVSVGLHLDRAHERLEARDVDLAVKGADDALQVAQLGLLGEMRVNFGLVGLAVEGLGHRLLVRLLVEFLLEVRETRVQARLQKLKITVVGRRKLLGRFPVHLLVELLKAGTHLGELILIDLVSRRLHLIHDVLDVIERGLVLHVILEVGTGDLVFHEFAGFVSCQTRLDVESHLRHSLLHVDQVCLCRELLVHI